MKDSKNIKAKVMKAAWTIYRKYKVRSMQNWSKSLKKAWVWVKEKSDTASFYVETIIRQTEKAIQVRVDNKVSTKIFWLPKSQIEIKMEGLMELIIVPNWLATKLIADGSISPIALY